MIFKQVAGIPMGGNASPLIANLVLSFMEFKYFQRNEVKINYKAAIFRYVDDILAINIDISELIKNCYAPELEINVDNGLNNKLAYMDLQFDFNSNSIAPYNKVDIFKFHVNRAFHASSCVRKSLITGCIIGRLITYARISIHYSDFYNNVLSYFTILVSRDHDKKRIVEGLVKFCATYKTMLWKYNLCDKNVILNKLINP